MEAETSSHDVSTSDHQESSSGSESNNVSRLLKMFQQTGNDTENNCILPVTAKPKSPKVLHLKADKGEGCTSEWENCNGVESVKVNGDVHEDKKGGDCGLDTENHNQNHEIERAESDRNSGCLPSWPPGERNDKLSSVKKPVASRLENLYKHNDKLEYSSESTSGTTFNDTQNNDASVSTKSSSQGADDDRDENQETKPQESLLSVVCLGQMGESSTDTQDSTSNTDFQPADSTEVDTKMCSIKHKETKNCEYEASNVGLSGDTALQSHVKSPVLNQFYDSTDRIKSEDLTIVTSSSELPPEAELFSVTDLYGSKKVMAIQASGESSTDVPFDEQNFSEHIGMTKLGFKNLCDKAENVADTCEESTGVPDDLSKNHDVNVQNEIDVCLEQIRHSLIGSMEGSIEAVEVGDGKDALEEIVETLAQVSMQEAQPSEGIIRALEQMTDTLLAPSLHEVPEGRLSKSKLYMTDDESVAVEDIPPSDESVRPVVNDEDVDITSSFKHVSPQGPDERSLSVSGGHLCRCSEDDCTCQIKDTTVNMTPLNIRRGSGGTSATSDTTATTGYQSETSVVRQLDSSYNQTSQIVSDAPPAGLTVAQAVPSGKPAVFIEVALSKPKRSILKQSPKVALSTFCPVVDYKPQGLGNKTSDRADLAPIVSPESLSSIDSLGSNICDSPPISTSGLPTFCNRQTSSSSENSTSSESQKTTEGVPISNNGEKQTGEVYESVTLRRKKARNRGKSESPRLRPKAIHNVNLADSDPDSPRQSEEDSDDDEDAGVYGESHRNSRWLYLGDGMQLTPISFEDTPSESGKSSSGISTDTPDLDSSHTSFDLDSTLDSISDGDIMKAMDKSCDSGAFLDMMPKEKNWCEVFANDLPTTKPLIHCRSESISTTASEHEFRKRYHAKTTRIVQRKSSTQLYQRMSDRFYDEERIVVLERPVGGGTFGYHVLGSQPTRISAVEAGSIAAKSGLRLGDVIIEVNGVNVLEASHAEVVSLMAQDRECLKLCVSADRIMVDEPLCMGYLVKQGGSGILKNWRRRWFVLKPDQCLYYYKTQEDKDPLGAILLTNYTISKAPEINRRFAFKAVKYSQRTYYFQAESEDDMNTWANAMSACVTTTAKTDTWLDISSHNVGLPALAIKSPDCHGYLTKLGNRRKNWKRRYCVLKDACLYYYLELHSSTAQGVAHLHGYRVEEGIPFKKTFGFTLIPPEQNMRTFFFFSDNDTDKHRWLDALQKSIGRWVKADG